MSLPRKVYIAGIPYKVRKHKNLDYKKAGIKSDNPKHRLLGYCTSKKQVIGLDDDQAHDCERITFWHEALHGILDNTHFSRLEQEELCCALETLLYTFIRDNPKAVAYIQEKKKK